MPRLQDAVPGDPQRTWQRHPNPVLIDPLHLAPESTASYKDYWAFHNPLWDNTTALPAGEVFSLDTLMPREDFVKTPVFNEWWKAADYGLEMLGANLLVEDQMSSLICVVNPQGNDALTSEQTRVFETA